MSSVRFNTLQLKPPLNQKSRANYGTAVLISAMGITSVVIAYFSDKFNFLRAHALSTSKQNDFVNTREARLSPSSKDRTVPIIETDSQSNNVRFDSSTTDNNHHEDIIDLNIIRHMPVETAILTTAPNVPPPITRHHPVILKVDL
ncbi:unnamed protein product [Rotaria sp. Silwood1]|nr:unnamed protein product [Rotaria sp. Silwood1]CAF1265512.1 unnamed protein product [Rotaria sp. Silwood1]CAF1267418.1 unnamed protein product [Rotaria sp. Silwood1]CAF3536691.1 unnamed protein product [Rotaria sp. Silwood1]CAF3537208.1 unnamed protein product [Rotaria sp. Silwood1]